MTLFQELNRQGQTTVLVTHDSAVGDMCGRVVRLYYGRVDQDQIIPAPVDASRLLAADAAPQP
jgi:ABC-type lipoprotein export system ATPase subunit